MNGVSTIGRYGGRGALLACALLLSGCGRTSLLEGLDERQANEVVAVMLRNNISAQKEPFGKKQFQVQVAPSDLAEAVELVEREDLPSAPRRQIADAFPADAMVSTPLSEQARLLSAIEQRLEESLSTIHGVHSARVHVSYDMRNRGANARSAPDTHVAAVLIHDPDANAQIIVQSAKRFLRNTFVNVSYENVSVVLSEAPRPRPLETTPPPSGYRAWMTWVVVGVLAVLGLGMAAIKLVPKGTSKVWRAIRWRTRTARRRLSHAR